jgi:general bacterial porin, GBP family
MKKNLIALAILGAFSGAALAQSNVTLYGIIDVNFQYNDPDVGASTRGINSGHQSGSRFGIRGSEALSPNLNAVFTLEGGYDISTGQSLQGGRLFGRQAWGGLAGGWGTVVAGRVATFSSGTGSFDMFGNIDPFVTGWGDSSLGSTFTPSGALRLDNSILYQSPVWGGFRFGAGYSFNGNGAENAGSGNNNRVFFTGASFATGPFYAAITYDIIEVSDLGVAGAPPTAVTAGSPRVPSGADDQKMLQIGATFDLKFLKIHGAYAKEDHGWFDVGLGIRPDAGADADSWMAGVTIPLFGGSLLGSYQKRDGDDVTVCLLASTTAPCPPTVPGTPPNIVTRQSERDVWAIGYAYPLSRRTNLYINYSDSDGEGALQGNTTADRKQYTMGIRHLF